LTMRKYVAAEDARENDDDADNFCHR
jgi:hypothetical protein